MTSNTSEQAARLLAQRYGAQDTPRRILVNDTVRTMLQHKSVRAYLPDSLPEGALETMVAAAQSASSSSNLHQWSVVAVSDPDLKSQVRVLARLDAYGTGQPYIDEAPVILLWVADMARNHTIAVEDGGSAEVMEYVDAFLMSSIDAALAAQNATVAAESLGLGTVYIGATRNKARELAELVGLPQHSFVVFGLVVGRPDPARDTNVRPRPAQEVVLHHNHYDLNRSLKALEPYEDAFRSFREASGMKPKTWKGAVQFAANDVETMDGRQDLRQTVQDRGFTLR